MEASGSKINLPTGAKISPGIETSQVNGQGTVVQGVKFGMTLKDGTHTTVFVPYTDLDSGNWSAIDALFKNRAANIEAITG